jgi:hypothetical protein
MAGLFAIVASFLAFVVPLGVPLLAQRWRSYFITLAIGAAFFAWLTWDIGRQAPGTEGFPGAFLGGLMLFGFAGGAIARFVMLLSRR